MNGEMLGYDWSLGDDRLRRLIEDSACGDPERARSAGLAKQPGGYACSTPEIDFIVDVAKTVPGVAGAQISGAGLGGCVMILVREQSVDALVERLKTEYYRPNGHGDGISVCIPVKGSGLVEV